MSDYYNEVKDLLDEIISYCESEEFTSFGAIVQIVTLAKQFKKEHREEIKEADDNG